MIVVPEAGKANAVPVAITSKPVRRRRIGRRSAIAAQKCDGVPFDKASLARGSGRVANTQPQERHGPDMVADKRLESSLRLHDVGTSHDEPSRGSTGVSADAPGRRQVDVVTTSQCDTCEEAKDRPPVISGAGARCAAMLRQPAPQRTSALGRQRVGSYPRNPGATFRSVPCFADFPEKIHPSFRPVHIAIAIGQNARAADAGFDLAEKPVEANGVGEAVSHGGIYRATTIACPGSSQPSEQSRSGPDHATRVPEIRDNLGRLER